MKLDSTIISAIIGVVGVLVGVVVTIWLKGIQEKRRKEQERIEKKINDLLKLKNLLVKGKTLYEQAGGLAFEIEYDPEDKTQYNMILEFIEHNAKVEEQRIEAGVPPDLKEVKDFLKNATYLKTQVTEGKTTDWLRSQFPSGLEEYVDKELGHLYKNRRPLVSGR